MLVDQLAIDRLRANTMHAPNPSPIHNQASIPGLAITEAHQVVGTETPFESEVTEPEPCGLFVDVGDEEGP